MKLLLALCPLFASATPTIWPMPSSLVENGANLTVGASTTFFVEKAAVAGSSSSSSSALLTEAFTRYTSLTCSARHHIRRYGPDQGQGQ